MPRRYYLLLTAATLVGAFLRLWQITQVPPGLHYDLAATALLGNEVAFNGYRPIFISAYTGHEALFYYWLALWFRLVGSSIFSLRLAAAMLGILAIPATFFAVRELLRYEGADSLPLAALAAAFLATAFFHVVFSRFGFRAISEPVVQALAIGFLFRGLHQAGQQRHLGRPFSHLPLLTSHLSLLLSGLLTGLDAYTYLAARLFPLPLLVFWVVLLLSALRRHSSRSSNREGVMTDASRAASTPPVRAKQPPKIARFGPARWWRLLRPYPTAGQQSIAQPGAAFSNSPITLFALFSLAAVVTVAPLVVYFVQNPQDFFNRAAQVAPRPGETALVVEGIRRAAEMIFINGEPYDRYNLPGLPLLGPTLGFCLIVGLLVTLRNAILPPRRDERPGTGTAIPLRYASGTMVVGPVSRAAEWMLLAWLPAMLLPTALAVHDIFPSNLRALGVVPLLFLFPARGLLVSYRWLQRRLPGPIIPYAYPMAVVTLAALAFGAYFTAQDYFLAWAHLPDQAQNNDADLTNIAAYLNANDNGQSSIYVSAIHYRHPTLAYLARDYDQLHWLTGGSALVVPAGRPALYLFARSAPPPAEWIAGWQPNQVAAPLDPDNVPSFRAYRFAAGQAPPLPVFAPLAANYGNFATLTGYRVITQSTELLLDLRWQIANLPAQGDYLPYARLTDTWGNVWTQSGGFSYPSEQWQPGDLVLTRLSLPLPAGLPAGTYTVTAGLYSSSANRNLPHLAADGAYAGERALVTSLPLHGRPAATLSDLRAENTIIPPLSHTGLDGSPTLLGYSLDSAAVRQGQRMQLTLYWFSPSTFSTPGELNLSLGQQPLYTGQPVHDTLPFDNWIPGQVLVDRYALKVPAVFPPGPAPLVLQLPGFGSATLANVTVAAVDRTLTRPPIAFPIDASLGGLAALAGYNITPTHPATLSLVWHALAPIDLDYTVFVHVLDATGQLAAQADAQPRAGAYPTSLWEPGEYITDDYQFNLPPGRYTAQVGLYLPETGARLPLAGGAGDAITIAVFDIK